MLLPEPFGLTSSGQASVVGGIAAIWQRQIANERGFEAVYVAALRSVGVAARLGRQGQAELWTGVEWMAAPRPLLEQGLPSS